MATIIEKARWLAESSFGCYEVFATEEDARAFIDFSSESEEGMREIMACEIWQQRIASCQKLLEDFEPCIFDVDNGVVDCYIRDGKFVHDGKTYTED